MTNVLTSFLDNNFLALELFAVHCFDGSDCSFVSFKVNKGVVALHFNLFDGAVLHEFCSQVFGLAFALNLGDI